MRRQTGQARSWIGLLLHFLLLATWGFAGRAAPVNEVVVVFKTHFDIGYTDMASNVVARYRTTMIDGALEVVEASRGLPTEQQFVWTLAGWPMEQILGGGGGVNGTRLERIQSALRDGRFVVHGWPFTTHTELLELEDLARGLGSSVRTVRMTGQPLPRDAKMTDVPSHSWVIPTLLRRAGIEFLHLGCNAASRSPEVPRLFWWEGPDGSRVLTMYTAESYGTGLVPPADWPHRTWLALIHTGDNHGPPTPAEVRALLAEAAAKLPGVRVRIGRLSDFSDALLAEHPTLPVIRGDMPDTWIHGPMSDPAGARLARLTRPELSTAESLQTMLRVWGVVERWPTQAVDHAFEQSLLYGEHTWGGGQYWIRRYDDADGFPYGDQWRVWRRQPKVQRLESSWEEHTDYIRGAARWSREWLKAGLDQLARSVAVAGRRVVVFNPLPWTRDGEVVLDTGDLDSVRGWRAVERRAGGTVEPVTIRDGQSTFVARAVPGLGYRTYVPAEPERDRDPRRHRAQADPVAGTLENEHFRVVLDPVRGVLRSVVERRSGREWVDAASAHGFGAFLYERFSRLEVDEFVATYVKIRADWATNELGKPLMPTVDQAPYRAESPGGFQTRCEITPTGVEAIMTTRGVSAGDHGTSIPCPVTLRVRIPNDLPWLELEMTLHDKPADPWPEAGWLCLPFTVGDPNFRLGRLGGVVNPAVELVPGSNHELFALNGGLTVTGPDGRGIGLCSLDAPLVSLGRPGCWRFSSGWRDRPSAVYVNLFNNQWTTNFRLWNGGTWTYRVRLWAAGARGKDRDNLVVPSLEQRWPLRAASVAGVPGSLVPARAGLTVSERGILVTSFGPADDQVANPDSHR
jgi:alpha-mannosidase